MKALGVLTDEQLAELAKTDERAMDEIIRRFEPMVGGKVSAFYLVSGDRDDLMQAGRLAITEAVRSYDAAKGGSFVTFAALCVKRKLIDAVKADNTMRNQALNQALSIDGTLGNEDDALSFENIISAKGTPEQHHLEREAYDETLSAIVNATTAVELDVLSMYLDGKSYAEIADSIGTDKKHVDNTIQKIKRKIREIVKGR